MTRFVITFGTIIFFFVQFSPSPINAERTWHGMYANALTAAAALSTSPPLLLQLARPRRNRRSMRLQAISHGTRVSRALAACVRCVACEPQFSNRDGETQCRNKSARRQKRSLLEVRSFMNQHKLRIKWGGFAQPISIRNIFLRFDITKG